MPLRRVSADHRRTTVRSRPRTIRQCTGRTPRARRRNVQWGADPTEHLGDRIRTIWPSRSVPRIRNDRYPDGTPNKDVPASGTAYATVIWFILDVIGVRWNLGPSAFRNARRGGTGWVGHSLVGAYRRCVAYGRCPVKTEARDPTFGPITRREVGTKRRRLAKTVTSSCRF